MKSQKGFSLAEVLIALALLGVICALMIPKILQGVGDSERKAKFKQTISSIDQLQTDGMLTGKLRTSNFRDFFLQRLNGVRTCPTNSSTEGCWDLAAQGKGPLSGSTTEVNQPGTVLKDGTVIVGLDNAATNYNPILIDWNGKNPPNKFGEDQLLLMTVVNRNDQTVGGKVYTSSTVTPVDPSYCGGGCAAGFANNVTLYDKVMQ